MALDPSILLQARGPQIEDPTSVRIKQATLADLLGQQQGRQLQLQEAQRGIQEQQTLADLYRSAGNDPTKLISGMAERGLGARIPEFQKQQAALGKSMTENEAAKYKLLKEQIDDGNAGMAALLSDPQLTHDKVLSFLSSRVRMGVLPAEQGAEIARSLPGDIPRLRQALTEKALQGLEASKRIDLILGKTEMQDQGGARQVFKTNQLTGEVTPGQSFAKTATPEAVMTDARTRSEGALNRGVQVRGQDMTDARARELNTITKEAKAEEKKAAATEKAVTKFSDTLQKEGIPELETAVSGAENALNRYKKGEVPGIGAVKNALPAAFMSDEGKDVRQALASVRNIVLSARSGAAVTDQELRRLVEEIGTGVGMSENDIRKGLEKVRTRLNAIKSNAAAGVDDATLQTYSDRGGIKIQRGNAGPKQGAEEDGYIFLGGNPADPKRWKKK